MAIETVKKARGDTTVSVSYDFGGDLDTAVDKFGKEVVYSKFAARSRQDLQNLLSRMVDVEKSDAEIESIVADWNPGKRVYTAPSLSSFAKKFKTLSKEQKAEMLLQMEGLIPDTDTE